MGTSPLSDVVSHQYERWMYPQPILDLPGWLESNWQWFDPSHAHRIFWPDQAYKPELDILVAGCGTNQAAVIAFTNPEARVTALDVSEPSLDHHRYLKHRYGLNNLELRRMPLEEAGSLGGDFDLIISTGVLHHLADPPAGMQALAKCLRPEGVMAVMLYAKYGRIGVEMLQGVFRELGLRQNDASVLMVRDALAALPADHPVKSYGAIAPDLRFDAGLVDTFLHGRERSYTIAECRELVASAGLAFQDLFLKAPYYPPAASGAGGAFFSTVAALPEEEQWSVMERIYFRNACHFFLACHKERRPSSYKIEFASTAALDYVPFFRHRSGLTGNTLARHNWSMSVDASQVALLDKVDGRRSIGEIVSALRLPAPNAEEYQEPALRFFRLLWQLDFCGMGLPQQE